ncbi:hypothetical protein [Mucilaginibacter ginsenosidivorax]|uniref:Outer membrane beta-barrel protein n=1 Tax=Mucilaginibacter ginsenosidivorax TaxID=862126 RepID=A0A5B8W0R4_9SPHI|nr:hypothetical protein [Mucilaginibacter ginsenosidivorax]QEC77394.1 hypothetical protein FSB76_16100 [Mucilaginibacter ginsenosidivorax]
MKNFISTLLTMLFYIAAYAQQINTESPVTGNAAQFVSPISVQVLVGSQGIGADVKYGFLPRLSGRLGFGIIPVSKNKDFHFFGFAVQGQFSTSFSNVHLLADYSPFNTNSIRLVGGASYITQGKATALISPMGGYNIGSQSLTKDQIGVLQADVTWKGVAPYLGIALFKGFPGQLLNVNVDVGSYYLSSPGTSFTGTKLLSDNDANNIQFNKNMQGYRWMPVVQLNFNLRIR